MLTLSQCQVFGPLPAFLYGWALLLIMATGAIAAVAFTFASYTGALFGIPDRLLPLSMRSTRQVPARAPCWQGFH